MKNTNKKFPVECLLNNHVTKDFRSALFPLTTSQYFLLISQFNITHGFVTPNNKVSDFKAFVGAVFCLFLNVYRYLLVAGSLNSETVKPTTFYGVYIDIFLNGFGAILIYLVNVLQSDNAVLIVVKLQQAMRVIDLDTRKILSNHKIWNYINVIGLFGFYAFSNVVSTFLYGDHYQKNMVLYLAKFSSIAFDLYQIYLTRTVSLIARLLVSFNRRIVITYRQTTLEGREDICIDGKTFNAMASAYRNIIQSFHLCKDVYQVSIVYYTVATFINILTKINLLLDVGSKYKEMMLLRSLWLCVWNLKNILLLINMSVACEQFYAQVRLTEATCARVVAAETQNLDFRRVCKNVLRYSRAAGGELRAGGVLAVGAALPARVLAAVLAYTVVLLQFAFLSGQ